MKKYLACLGKILLLLCGYYMVQMIAMIVFALIGGLGASGDIQSAMQQFLASRTALVSLAADAAAIAILVLGYSFSKRSFVADMRIAKVSVKTLWPVAIGAVAAAIAAGCIVRLLPEYIGGTYSGVVQQAASDESIIVRVLAAAIAAPVAQELIFRGCIYGMLSRCSGRTAALILSSVLYGVMHSSPAWIAIAFLLGLAFAFTSNAYGSIVAAIVFHVLFCLAGMPLFELTGELKVWAAGLIAIFALAALAFCLVRIRNISRCNAENGGNNVSGN